MMSGMRNAPPISISSPRDTMASRPLARVLRHEKHGGGIVVDHRRVLGAGQRANKSLHMVVAFAALAGRQVELERDRIPHSRDGRLDRRLGERRSAEIGVQHRAGQVEQRPQRRTIVPLEVGERLSRNVLGAGDEAPPGLQRRASSFNAARMAFVEAVRPKRSMRIPAAGVFRTASTGGRLRRCMEFIVSERHFSGQERHRKPPIRQSWRPHMSEI